MARAEGLQKEAQTRTAELESSRTTTRSPWLVRRVCRRNSGSTNSRVSAPLFDGHGSRVKVSERSAGSNSGVRESHAPLFARHGSRGGSAEGSSARRMRRGSSILRTQEAPRCSHAADDLCRIRTCRSSVRNCRTHFTARTELERKAEQSAREIAALEPHERYGTVMRARARASLNSQPSSSSSASASALPNG